MFTGVPDIAVLRLQTLKKPAQSQTASGGDSHPKWGPHFDSETREHQL